jgi:hypothetical protein
MTYFSERELGECQRNQEQLSGAAWAGIQTEIAARIANGSFGARYAETCPEGGGPIGTDELAFWTAMRARFSSLETRPWLRGVDEAPPIHAVMNMIEFCWRSVGKPIKRGYHSYLRHDHLSFDEEEGQAEFQEAINEIFRLNGLAFNLDDDGQIQRLAPPVLGEALQGTSFATGDSVLDGMLEDAREKFLSPDESVRREALEKLWDAFERVKTLEPGADKSVQAKALLDKAAQGSGPKFRDALDKEAFALRDIGNNFHIRHSETTQEPLSSSLEVRGGSGNLHRALSRISA